MRDEETNAEREQVIHSMVESLSAGQQRTYYVALVGYYIEGIPYPASGLTVDSTATVDARATKEGFFCTAFFPPDVLLPGTVEKNGVITTESRNKPIMLVQVQLEARYEDIWAVAEFIEGVQKDLFLDEETLKSRQPSFLKEAEEWYLRRN